MGRYTQWINVFACVKIIYNKRKHQFLTFDNKNGWLLSDATTFRETRRLMPFSAILTYFMETYFTDIKSSWMDSKESIKSSDSILIIHPSFKEKCKANLNSLDQILDVLDQSNNKKLQDSATKAINHLMSELIVLISNKTV